MPDNYLCDNCNHSLWNHDLNSMNVDSHTAPCTDCPNGQCILRGTLEDFNSITEPYVSLCNQTPLNPPTDEPYIHELAICEVPHIVLRVNELYRFHAEPDCESCQANVDAYKDES
jgi:hypothetical protein